MAKLPGDHLRLLIAGKPWEPADYIERLALVAASDPRVLLRASEIPAADMGLYLRACDVLVFPFERILTSSSVALAMSFGVPVIAPRMGCLPEMVRGYPSIIYEPGSEAGLREALAAAPAVRQLVGAQPTIRPGWRRAFQRSGRGYHADVRGKMKIALYHNLPSGGARRAMVELVKRLVARGHLVDEFCPATADLSFLPLDGVVGRTVVQPLTLRGVMPPPRAVADALSHRRPSAGRPWPAGCRGPGRRRLPSMPGAMTSSSAHDCQLVQNPDVLRHLHTPAVHFCHHGAGNRLLRAGGPQPQGWTERAKWAFYWPRAADLSLGGRRRAVANIRAAGRCWPIRALPPRASTVPMAWRAGCATWAWMARAFAPWICRASPSCCPWARCTRSRAMAFCCARWRCLPVTLRLPLVIAANSGDPAERARLERLARDLGVTLTIRQVLDDAEMLSLYNRAAAFVYTPIMEPWGLAAVEAMACGAPVVAVREGGLRESVQDGVTGLLTPRSR